MFSAITNILSPTPPRHAEENDTRQNIQRHDPDYEHQRKKKKHKKDQPFDENEATALSVQALQLFLNKTIKPDAQSPFTEKRAHPAAQDQSDTSKTIESSDYKIQQEMNLGTRLQKTSANAARAASLYQTTTANKRDNILLETTDLALPGPELDLSAADFRTIHRIIDSLKTLSLHNIKYIYIRQADSFLESLEDAISYAKSQIGQ